MRYKTNLRFRGPGVCAATHIAWCANFRLCFLERAQQHISPTFSPTFFHTFLHTFSMQHLFKTAIPLLSALALGLVTATASADSTSSASSAASTSIGSSSTSVEKSSNSSSTKDKVAQGPYTVVEMVALAQHPDMLRLRLKAVATTPGTNPAGEIVLLLPRRAAERGQLALGQVIAAEHRPYGIAFATVTTAGHANTTPFFLVLDDAWFGELASRPLGV